MRKFNRVSSANKFSPLFVNCYFNGHEIFKLRTLVNQISGESASSKKAALAILLQWADKAKEEPESAFAQKCQRHYEAVILGKEPTPDTSPIVQQVDTSGILDQVMAKVTPLLSEAHKVLEKGVTIDPNEMRELAKEALQEAAKQYRPLQIKSPGKKTKTVKGVLPPEFDRMVQLGSARKNILLVGPAGCGKTYLAAKLAEALSLDYSDQSCSEGMSESAFTGWLLPVGTGGRFEYVQSEFVRIYENGGVFLLDELDASDPNLLVFINKALANDGFTLPIRTKKPWVAKHKDFIAVGAANTFGHGADSQYVGRNQLDAATLDRFKVGLIQMDYSAAVEESLISSDLLEWGRGIRRNIKAHGLRRIMSTRVLRDLQDMVDMYQWDRTEWDNAYFADWSREERSLVMGGR